MVTAVAQLETKLQEVSRLVAQVKELHEEKIKLIKEKQFNTQEGADRTSVDLSLRKSQETLQICEQSGAVLGPVKEKVTSVLEMQLGPVPTSTRLTR